MKKKLKQAGFTLIELLMVVLLLAILAAVAIPQFIDFQVEAKDAATEGTLGSIRTSIANQYAQMIVRCDSNAGVWPPHAALAANDITVGGVCTAAQITSVPERRFVPGTDLPDNPWGNNNAVADCRAGGDCVRGDATACDGSATFTEGWCYDSQTGDFWADSQNSPSPGTEESF